MTIDRCCSDPNRAPLRAGARGQAASQAVWYLDHRNRKPSPATWLRDAGCACTLTQPSSVLCGDAGTRFVFPSAGKHSQTDAPISTDTVHDPGCLVPDDAAKPRDLAFMDLQRLRDGGMGAFANRSGGACRSAPDVAHLAIVDAWVGQLDDFRKSSEVSCWR